VNRFRIEYPLGEFDLELCVGSGQVFRWEKLPDGRFVGVDGPNWFLVTLVADGLIEVASNAEPGAFVRLFRLDESVAEIERAALSRGIELAPYLKALKGLRLLRPSDPHEVLFCFLCTPNNNLARIKQMVRTLAAYGSHLANVEGIELTRFPTVERIAALGEADLRERGFGYRSRTIPAVARLVASKPKGWLEGLRDAAYEEAHMELRSLPGVGAKLADCVCLFGLHHTEAAPMDTHLWQACCRLYFPEWRGKALTDRRYQAAADYLREKFGPLTGWAHQYLFYEDLLNWRTRR
jgi:N-glycosylase/DNA lyase